MTSNAPKFRLLHLPRLALESVLSNFDHLDRFEFSTCSKRCKRVVESLKHGCTEIEVELFYDLTSVTVISGSTLKEYTWFYLFKSPPSGDHQFVTFNGRTVRMRKTHGTVCIYCSEGLTVKALVDHLVETFKVPIKTLKFFIQNFENYLDFVQFFPKCDNLRICEVGSISKEDITYLKEHVKHKHFYINGNLR
ncbi:hypothetical protein GCK72_004632 [Caenorhabditis remanei]|uniref:F-box domain-containing protein n=1 Tax=Caenorhabditis remanei TaxID=31234 RepID=A0A6A5HE70_CAERE|nr:hypothetical protein GCK72_004632 [Caenorhabditis remanei]KAF1764683.1 hypothetical protein GCK72_004632 [Caenorhabditis remanei]